MNFLRVIFGWVIPHAYAQNFIEQFVNATSINSSWAVAGGGIMLAILITIAYHYIQPFLWIAGLIAITATGVRMVAGQQEDATEQAKKVVTTVVAAITMSFLIPPLVT